MKASELRIGNLTIQGEIKSFFENGVHVGFGKCHIFDNLEPIPLTKEWLLRLGFEMEYSKFTNVYKYFLVNTPFGYCQGQFNVFTQTGCFSVEIKYVHQLQNLYFALTNEELIYEQQK